MKSVYKENYNLPSLVNLWGDYIDWEKRRIAENGFLKGTLEKNNCHNIFEAGLWDGCDSIYLLKEGFDVTSNELDLLFTKKAQQNAREANVKLSITSFDWRTLDSHFKKETFDALLCLGNTLTYLFTKVDQMKTLKNFYNILRKNGILIIDERNYQYILDNKKKLLSHGFKFRKNFVYCGELVDVRPVFISKNKVVLEYVHREKNLTVQLTVYPFKEGEIFGLLKEAGFRKILQYSDFKLGKNSKADFFTYVAHK